MNPLQPILAIETSCDDTSIAVVDRSGHVLSLCSANQDQVHAPFGGVVPEIAGRSHTLTILPLIEQALKSAGIAASELAGIAVTNRPGLIGSLLVGVVTAKTLALAWKKPLIGVNHLEGHLHAPFLRDPSHEPPPSFTYPFIALTISGGHTALYYVPEFGHYELLGQTIDDAAGEAFDKFAKMLGLPYPGGVQVDRCAQAGGVVTAFSFPRPMIDSEDLSFSFSGLKTAAMRQLLTMSEPERQERLADLCASYQEAIVDVLLHKLGRAVALANCERVVLTGGVSANSRLRTRAEQWAAQWGVELVVPPIRYCTDNAAMIGLAGALRLAAGECHDQTLKPTPQSWPGDWVLPCQ